MEGITIFTQYDKYIFTEDNVDVQWHLLNMLCGKRLKYTHTEYLLLVTRQFDKSPIY